MFKPDLSLAPSFPATAVGSVLIIEDDGLISMTMELTAKELGATRVEVFGNPVDAECAAREGAFDCAILDIHVAQGSTYETADILAARNIPFVFCTGLPVDDVDARHRHRPILPKPYSEDAFRACVMQLVCR